MVWKITLLAVFVLLIASISQTQGKVDPDSGRLRLLLFGESWGFVPKIFMTDPKVTAVAIPGGDEATAPYMARFMRIYMPRTYQDWVDNFDVFMLSDLVPWGFTDNQIFWMRRSIQEEGMGMILSEMGWYVITGWTGNACEDWMNTVLYDAYPCDMVPREANQVCWYLKIVQSGAFLDLPRIEQVAFGWEGQGLHIPRPGSTTWAIYRLGKEAAIITRPYEKGMTVANSMGLERFYGQSYYEWKYYKDYFVNHVYLAGGVPVPEDLELVHMIREQLETFRDHRALIIGMIDFIDKFNANTRPVEQMLADMNPMREEAKRLYIEQSYEDSSAVLKEAMERFDEINAEAVKLKEQALLWIYIIEWSVVSATFLITGIIIWALMVRRKLYREVKITRGPIGGVR